MKILLKNMKNGLIQISKNYKERPKMISKIVRNENSIKLKYFISKGYEETFKYQGYYYTTLRPDSVSSMHTRLTCTSGYLPCLNLNSKTIRGIKLDEYVDPVKVTLNIHESSRQEKEPVKPSVEETFVILV